MLVKIVKFKINMLFLLLPLLIAACGGGGGGGTSSSDATVSLGGLSNGSSVQSSSGSFVVSNGETTTGTIGLSGGDDGYTGVVTMVVSAANSVSLQSSGSNLPTVTMSPTPCVLTSGNPDQLSCQYTINTTSEVVDGNYIITPIFTPNAGEPEVLSGITLSVSGGATPTAGSLSIIVDGSTIATGESSIATVVLSGSVGVSDLPVTISSSDTSVLNVTPASCVLSTESNSCQVFINGESQGVGYIMAASSGYATANSADISVYIATVPGNLTITLESSNLTYGESTVATVTLSGSIEVSGLAVTVASSNSDVATVDPGSCTLSSTNTTCTVTVIAGSQTNTTTILASAAGYIAAQAEVNVITMPGTLSISLNAPNLTYDESTVATITLNGSVGISDMVVDVSSGDTSIATVNPGSCVVSSTNNTCAVTVTVGAQTGSTDITASSGVYESVGETISADRVVHYAYVTNVTSDNISMYSLNSSTGQLSALNPAVTPDNAAAPVGVVTGKSGKFLYVVNRAGNSVGIYSINSATGVLSAPQYVATESNPFYIAIDPTGRYAYVTNFNSNTISMYSIDQDNGMLTALSPATIATESAPRGIAIDPSGKHVYIGNYRSDSVSMYSIESSTGQLVSLNPATVSVNGSPLGIVIHPSGEYAYVNSEDAIITFLIDQNTGVLSISASTHVSYVRAEQMVIDKTGKYVFAPDSASNKLYSYTISIYGSVSDWPSYSYVGNYPTGITLDPSGKYVYVANAGDNTVSMLRVNESSSHLTSLTEPVIAAGTEPTGITFN